MSFLKVILEALLTKKYGGSSERGQTVQGVPYFLGHRILFWWRSSWDPGSVCPAGGSECLRLG